MRARPRAAAAKTSSARPTRCTRRSSSCCARIATTMPPGLMPSSERRQITRLRREAAHLERWLERHREERKSAKGNPRLSNRTDNESAKMPTNKGVVQGYTEVAAVDDAQLRAPDTIVAADSGYYRAKPDALW